MVVKWWMSWISVAFLGLHNWVSVQIDETNWQSHFDKFLFCSFSIMLLMLIFVSCPTHHLLFRVPWYIEISCRLLPVEMFLLNHHSRRFQDACTLLQVYMNTGDGTQRLPIPSIAVLHGGLDQLRWEHVVVVIMNNNFHVSVCVALHIKQKIWTVFKYFVKINHKCSEFGYWYIPLECQSLDK